MTNVITVLHHHKKDISVVKLISESESTDICIRLEVEVCHKH